jgi:hypothetical protein
MSLRRADPPSRVILPTLVCVWVWSRENKTTSTAAVSSLNITSNWKIDHTIVMFVNPQPDAFHNWMNNLTSPSFWNCWLSLILISLIVVFQNIVLGYLILLIDMISHETPFTLLTDKISCKTTFFSYSFPFQEYSSVVVSKLWITTSFTARNQWERGTSHLVTLCHYVVRGSTRNFHSSYPYVFLQFVATANSHCRPADGTHRNPSSTFVLHSDVKQWLWNIYGYYLQNNKTSYVRIT